MRQLFFLLTLISFFWTWSSVIAAIVNRTIDDTTGDVVTGSRPIYLPPTPGVWEGTTCSGCAIKPDSRLAFEGTWTAATYNPNLTSISIEMSFKGTAIYVFFILANFVADGITTETACNFTLNDRPPVPFSHKPTQSRDLEYNALVFSQANLPNDDHKLVISTSGIADRNIFVNFDYAIYTFDDTPIVPTVTSSSTSSIPTPTPASPTSSTRSTSVSTSILNTAPQTPSSKPGNSSEVSTSKVDVGVIAGSAIGGFVALAAIVFLFICFRRRRHGLRDRATDFIIDDGIAQPTTRIPFPIDVASASERYRERPQTHSDFLQSGTIISPHTAQRSFYDNYENPAVPVWSSAHPVSNRSVAFSASQSSYNNDSPYGGIASDTSGNSSGHPLVLRNHTRSNSTATAESQSKEAVRRARQSEIDNQLRAAKRDFHDLRADLRTGNVHRSNTRSNPLQNNESEMAEMREQMRLMKQQIEYLQTQQQSEWAQGLSDEPPPGYFPQSPGRPRSRN